MRIDVIYRTVFTILFFSLSFFRLYLFSSYFFNCCIFQTHDIVCLKIALVAHVWWKYEIKRHWYVTIYTHGVLYFLSVSFKGWVKSRNNFHLFFVAWKKVVLKNYSNDRVNRYHKSNKSIFVNNKCFSSASKYKPN